MVQRLEVHNQILGNYQLSLIDNFPVSGYGLRVFVPRVQTGGRDLIADQFRKSGSRVFEVAAYETRCPDSIPEETIDIISNRNVDAIIFSSLRK